MPILKRKIATAAATASTSDGTSTEREHRHVDRRAQPMHRHACLANSTCSANQTARFRITPTTAAVMAPSAAPSALLARSASTKGAPKKIQRKQGVKVTQVVSRPPSVAASSGGSAPGLAPGGEEAHELRHHDQRAGRGLGHAEPVQHLAGCHPVIVVDRLLGHVGQHGVGAAEGDHRHLAEEERDLGEDVVAAQADDRAPPPAPATAPGTPR